MHIWSLNKSKNAQVLNITKFAASLHDFVNEDLVHLYLEKRGWTSYVVLLISVIFMLCSLHFLFYSKKFSPKKSSPWWYALCIWKRIEHKVPNKTVCWIVGPCYWNLVSMEGLGFLDASRWGTVGRGMIVFDVGGMRQLAPSACRAPPWIPLWD